VKLNSALLVTAGTVDSLIETIFHTSYPKRKEFADVFLLTYTSFSNDQTLLQKLRGRFAHWRPSTCRSSLWCLTVCYSSRLPSLFSSTHAGLCSCSFVCCFVSFFLFQDSYMVLGYSDTQDAEGDKKQSMSAKQSRLLIVGFLKQLLSEKVPYLCVRRFRSVWPHSCV
jgi:RasGEF N-terminal motif